MSSLYEPDLYDIVTPGAFLGDIDWYRRKAQECGGPILELGAGTGRISVALARAGVIVHALDADRNMLAALRRKIAAESREVQARIDGRPFERDTDELVIQASCDHAGT